VEWIKSFPTHECEIAQAKPTNGVSSPVSKLAFCEYAHDETVKKWQNPTGNNILPEEIFSGKIHPIKSIFSYCSTFFLCYKRHYNK